MEIAVGRQFGGYVLALSLAVFPLTLAAQAPRGGQKPPQFKGIFEPINYPEDVGLLDAFFVSADVGWVAGGTTALAGGLILNTRDGGATWNVQYGDPQSSDPAVKDLQFLDERTGWAISRGRILHTRDGENWVLAGTMHDNYAGYFFTSQTTGVYLDPNDGIHLTRNGGRSWEPVFKCAGRVEVGGLTRAVQCEWRRLRFVTPRVGFAVGISRDADGVIFLARTEDGGATWTMTTGGATGLAEDATFLDERVGYVRTGYWQNGQVFKTEDGGKTWTGMAGSPGARMAFADPEVGWAFGLTKLSFTIDGGRRWNSREIPFPAPVTSFSLPRRDRGYVVGAHGMIYRYRVVPIAENVPKALAAPLMPAFDSPLDDQVERLEDQLAALEKAAAGTADSAVQAALTEPLAALELTVGAASKEAPQFAAKYRNLNLVAMGLEMITELPGHLQGLRESLQALKQDAGLKGAATALPALRTKTEGLSQLVRKFFQTRQGVSQ